VLVDSANIGQITVALDSHGIARGELELTGLSVPAVHDGSLIVVLDSLANTVLQGTFEQDND
jgi:hypothetical protein